MKIKNRLSLYFALIGSGVLLAVFAAFYLSFWLVLRNDFYDRLEERASVTARLFLQADELSTDSLDKVRVRFLNVLPGEVVRIYDKNNKASFIVDNMRYWSNGVIDKVREKHYLEYMEGSHQVVGKYYKDNQGNFVILVSATDQNGLRRLREVIVIMLVLFASVGSSLFLIGRWFAQQSLTPLDKLVKQIQKIKANKLNIRVDEGNGKDEISKLAYSFNRLLEHLENAFQMQKTYIANASHELRTPVTSIVGEIEVALYHPRSEDEYKLLLRSVLNDTEKLQDTISSLMELAQVDAGYMLTEQEDLRIDDLIWELQSYWNEKYGKGKLEVEMLELPEDESNLILSANRQLLVIALNNIIGNAFKFSDLKTVSLTLMADKQKIKIEIKDQGIGIPEISKNQVFNPFFRGDNAHNFTGSGIGLYITDKVVRLFNGNIHFLSLSTGGTVFSIEFKQV